MVDHQQFLVNTTVNPLEFPVNPFKIRETQIPM